MDFDDRPQGRVHPLEERFLVLEGHVDRILEDLHELDIRIIKLEVISATRNPSRSEDQRFFLKAIIAVLTGIVSGLAIWWRGLKGP